MSIYTPYFYIIQDIRNGIYYAGAKWAQGCHPDKLLIEGGYMTSSETIKELIRQHGLGSFIIRKIRTFETADQAQDYETRFLRRVKARSNTKFYNGHENDGTLDPQKMKMIMMKLYGVENPLQSPFIQEKVKKTNLKRYGVENPTQSTAIQEKTKHTNLERYGDIWQIGSKETREKIEKTFMERYGVKHNFSIPEVIENIKQTNIERYGTDNPFKSKEIQEKIKQTNKERYGVEYSMQSLEVRNRTKQTNLEKYGVEHNSQSALVKEKVKIKVDYLLSRPILDIIRKYKQKYNLTFGPGWVRKSDEYVENLLEELISEYGEIEDNIRIKPTNDYLYNRFQIIEIKKYQKKYRLKFGTGWTRKSDIFINDLLDDLISKYGNSNHQNP